ncbi:DUF3293 domain-containing protein [Candidatus Peribacteria bacterium]|nr:DUF3293 domain-containing protein [Candidatus Peribacteria bacterium]
MWSSMVQSIHTDAVHYSCMSHESDQAILEIYNRTQFMVRDESDVPVYFTMGDKKLPNVVTNKQFAIVTAWNPMNRELDLKENVSRNRELEDILKEQQRCYYPSLGTCKNHAEESFTIENISQTDAVNLGKQFEQHAILFCDEKGPRFLFLEKSTSPG